MYDFNNLISLERLQYLTEKDNKELHGANELFLLDMYYRIFEFATVKGYINEIASLQQEYFSNSIMFSTSDYNENKVNFEKKVLGGIRFENDVQIWKKHDQYVLINFLIDQYKSELKNELLEYGKEEIFMLIYSTATAMSHMSILSNFLFKHGLTDSADKDIGISNLIIDSIGILYKPEHAWVLNFFGTYKKCCEYLINQILILDRKDFKSRKKNIELQKLFIIAECIIEKLSIVKSLELFDKMNYSLKIHNGLLYIDENLTDKMELYIDDLYNHSVDLYSAGAEKVYELFEETKGYHPRMFEEYVLNLNNKYLNTKATVNLVEDRFVYTDFVISTGYDFEAISDVFNCLSMKNNEDIDKNVFSPDNRLYRTPIIKINNYFVLSNQLLIEASSYFRHRILKAEFNHDDIFKQVLKNNYDEEELTELIKLIKFHNIKGGINFNLQNYSKLNKLINAKGVTKEIDFYFIYDNTLYTMEFKNQSIDNGLLDVCKSYSSNIKNKNKHVKLIEILRSNIEIVEEILESKITSIRSFLVFKNKNSFSDFYTENDIYVCSYKQFYCFCKDLFNHGDFYSMKEKNSI